MTAKWFVAGDNQAFGPYTLEQLREFVGERRVLRATQIRNGEHGVWFLAERLPDLFPLESATKPPVIAQLAAVVPPPIANSRPEVANAWQRLNAKTKILISLAVSCVGLSVAYQTARGIVALTESNKQTRPGSTVKDSAMAKEVAETPAERPREPAGPNVTWDNYYSLRPERMTDGDVAEILGQPATRSESLYGSTMHRVHSYRGNGLLIICSYDYKKYKYGRVEYEDTKYGRKQKKVDEYPTEWVLVNMQVH